MKPGYRFAAILAMGLLAGCSGQSGYEDIDDYMHEIRARPTGKIEPLPTFKPYETFSYNAAGIRSPFDPPIKVSAADNQINSNVKPDFSRIKQYLEQFDIDTFSLAGSMSNDQGLWALVRASDGIHRVKVGDYLGRNHGRVTFIGDTELKIIEIVPAGEEAWIERPRVLRLDSGESE